MIFWMIQQQNTFKICFESAQQDLPRRWIEFNLLGVVQPSNLLPHSEVIRTTGRCHFIHRQSWKTYSIQHSSAFACHFQRQHFWSVVVGWRSYDISRVHITASDLSFREIRKTFSISPESHISRNLHPAARYVYSGSVNRQIRDDDAGPNAFRKLAKVRNRRADPWQIRSGAIEIPTADLDGHPPDNKDYYYPLLSWINWKLWFTSSCENSLHGLGRCGCSQLVGRVRCTSRWHMLFCRISLRIASMELVW